jgi:hypothetical protein
MQKQTTVMTCVESYQSDAALANNDRCTPYCRHQTRRNLLCEAAKGPVDNDDQDQLHGSCLDTSIRSRCLSCTNAHVRNSFCQFVCNLFRAAEANAGFDDHETKVVRV